MKVLLVSERFPPAWGGSRMYYYEVARRFPPAEIKVVTKRVDGHAEFDARERFSIVRRFEVWDTADYRTLFTKYPGYMAYLTTELLRTGADLVHSGDCLPAGLFSVVWRSFLGVPYIYWSHGEDHTLLASSRYLKHVLALVCRQADLVVANSRFTVDLLRRTGIREDRIRLVTPGVDGDRFSRPVETSDLRERHGLEGKRTILTVARFSPRKGYDTGLRALELLRDRHPDVVYLMVGKGGDKPRIQALVKELGLEDRVRWAQDVPLDDLVRHYALCDVFLLANRAHRDHTGQVDVEGFGMVFLEAGCQAKPVVGGRSGGTVDAVMHGVTGLLCSPDSPEDFAQALDRLLSDPDLARKMGQAGKDRALRDFGWDRKAGEIRRFSAEVVEKRRPGLAYRALRTLWR
ncbi:MAG: glycosyltransferase family 4 protein [Deltaproteobacteria bacterium]|nr:glycosyltransferase family 4 protein [Deltaproteobacteria bacterium]